MRVTWLKINPILEVKCYKISPQLAGNPLPQAIYSASIIKYDDSFILVGGYNGNDWLGDIYQYNTVLDTFEKLPSELKTPRRSHVSLLVPQSLFPECA